MADAVPGMGQTASLSNDAPPWASVDEEWRLLGGPGNDARLPRLAASKKELVDSKLVPHRNGSFASSFASSCLAFW